MACHVHQLFLIFNEPSLWLELISIMPPNSSVMVLGPAVHSDSGLWQMKVSIEILLLKWC